MLPEEQSVQSRYHREKKVGSVGSPTGEQMLCVLLSQIGYLLIPIPCVQLEKPPTSCQLFIIWSNPHFPIFPD